MTVLQCEVDLQFLTVFTVSWIPLEKGALDLGVFDCRFNLFLLGELLLSSKAWFQGYKRQPELRKEKLCLSVAGGFNGFFWWLVFVAHLNLENFSFPLCCLYSELLKEKSWWTGLDPSFVMFSLMCGYEPLFGSMLICRWCQPALENQLTSVQSKEAFFQCELWKKK